MGNGPATGACATRAGAACDRTRRRRRSASRRRDTPRRRTRMHSRGPAGPYSEESTVMRREIISEEQLRDIVGQPPPYVANKVADRLSGIHRDWLAPFPLPLGAP